MFVYFYIRINIEHYIYTSTHRFFIDMILIAIVKISSILLYMYYNSLRKINVFNIQLLLFRIMSFTFRITQSGLRFISLMIWGLFMAKLYFIDFFFFLNSYLISCIRRHPDLQPGRRSSSWQPRVTTPQSTSRARSRSSATEQ